MEYPPSCHQSFEDEPGSFWGGFMEWITPSMSSRKYLLVMFLLSAVDAVLLYYYVAAVVYPVPQSILSRNVVPGWDNIVVFTFVLGFFIFVAAVLGMATFVYSLAAPWRLEQYYALCRRSNAWFYAAFTPLYLLFLGMGILVPFFGGWFLPPLVQALAWDYACDQYPMFAILDANLVPPSEVTYQPDGSVTPSAHLAHFYLTSDATWLFTFNLTTPRDNSTNRFSDEFSYWVLELQDIQSAVPPASYPLLQAVQYDMSGELTGNCAPTINNTSVLASPACLSGNFTAGGAVLRFDIATPLAPDWPHAQNWTQPGAARTALDVGTFTPQPWTRAGHPPGATLRAGGRSGHTLLKTVVTRPRDPAQLKVCIAGPQADAPALLHPAVLVPLGVILMRQADYAIAKAGLEPTPDQWTLRR